MRTTLLVIFLLACGYIQSQNIVNITSLKEFQDYTKKEYTIVFFWAKWSGPSRMQDKAFSDVFKDLEKRKPRFAKVDVDKNENIAKEMGINDVPMILFLKGGKVVHTQRGYTPAPKLQPLYMKYLPE